MAGKILDNGMAVTLGLVGVVAAAGAVAKRGSAARRSPARVTVFSVPPLSAWREGATTEGPAYFADSEVAGYSRFGISPLGHRGMYVAFAAGEEPNQHRYDFVTHDLYFTTAWTGSGLPHAAGQWASAEEAREGLADALGRSGRRPRTGSRSTLDERVADLQFDMATLFGAREVKRPSELRRMRERALAENADLLRRIQEAKERGVDTRLLERDLRARVR
jgi:hypothetical protein